MAGADGRNIAGDKIRFFYADMLTEEQVTKINETYNQIASSPLAVGDIAGSGGLFFSAADEAAKHPALATNAYWIRGVDAVSGIGVTANSTSALPFGEESFNLFTGNTPADAEVTFWPDLSDTTESRMIKTSGGVVSGTRVALLIRIQGNTPANKTYHVVMGTIGGINYDPQKEAAQAYTRTVITEAVVFGVDA